LCELAVLCFSAAKSLSVRNTLRPRRPGVTAFFWNS
jgi:hypothetical protein